MTDLPALEQLVEVIEVRVRRPDLPVEVRGRLRNLRDDLASHVLAVRVLVTSGASPESVEPVLQRAAALVAEEQRRGSLAHD